MPMEQTARTSAGSTDRPPAATRPPAAAQPDGGGTPRAAPAARDGSHAGRRLLPTYDARRHVGERCGDGQRGRGHRLHLPALRFWGHSIVGEARVPIVIPSGARNLVTGDRERTRFLAPLGMTACGTNHVHTSKIERPWRSDSATLADLPPACYTEFGNPSSANLGSGSSPVPRSMTEACLTSLEVVE